MKFIVFWLTAVNALGFALMGIDKGRAARRQWRIPERTLIGIALLGGSIGTLAGMRFFHHKTRKPLFFIGVPTIIALQLAVTAMIVFLTLSTLNFT